MTASTHLDEALQDFVDGRLADVAADAVRTHLEGCAACRSVRDDLVAARDALGTLRAEPPLPADLLAAVTRALDAEEAPGATAPAPAARQRRWWLLAGTAAAAALVAYLATGERQVSRDAPAQAAADLAAVESGALALDVRTNEAAALERYFAAAPAGPRVRVIDLGMMGIALEGGTRHRLGGAASALYAYLTPTGPRLVCQMYEGRLSNLPPPDRAVDSKGFRFQIYSRGVVTTVFWQEGDLVCVLASTLPADDVIALAREKAMAPT